MASESEHRYNPAVWLMGVVAAIIVAATAWYLNSQDRKFDRLTDTLDRVSQSQNDISSAQSGMQKDIEWIKVGISDIYTEKDAEDAHQAIQRTTDDLYGKFRNVDERLKTIERETRNR